MSVGKSSWDLKINLIRNIFTIKADKDENIFILLDVNNKYEG